MITIILRLVFLISLLGLLGTLKEANAQNFQERMTRMTPATPEAASITRYGIYPVSMYTGVPGIEVPLYTVQVRDFTLPISIGYHASGIKVNDRASFVGLGWNLNAGGVISRTVMGLPDEAVGGIFWRGIKRANQIGLSDAEDINNITDQFLDSEQDLFSYNFMGRSGRFIFDENNKVSKITYDDVKVEFVGGNFVVTDVDGKIYLFEAKGHHTNYSEAFNKIGFPVTSWYLSKVILGNRKDTISFSYKGHSETGIRTIDYGISFGMEYDGSMNPTLTGAVNTMFYYENSQDLYLDQISFPNGKVRFVSSLGRSDYGGYMLDSVIVYNNTETIKRISLEHGYFNADPVGYNPYAQARDFYRLKLLSVKDHGHSGNDFREFRMEYENQFQLPPLNNCGVDWWGYSNGQNFNKHLIALNDNNEQYRFNFVVGTRTTEIAEPAVRTPDEVRMQAGMLRRIYFPTGGYSDFEFEANKINSFKTVPNPGGARNSFAKKDDHPVNNDRVVRVVSPVTVGVFDPTPATLSMHLPVTHSVTQPYAEFWNITRGTMTRYTRAPGEPANTSFNVALTAGDTYELRTHIQPDPDNPNDNGEVYVQLTLSWPSIGFSTIEEVQKGPGLRIKAIRNYTDANLLAGQEDYKYGENESGYGDPRFFNYLFKKRTHEQDYFYGSTSTSSSVITRKLEISSKPLYSYSDIGGTTIVYPVVTKYQTGAGTNNGKTVFTFDFDKNDKIYFQEKPDPSLLINAAWTYGQPLNEKTYKKNADNTYTSFSTSFATALFSDKRSSA